MLKAGYCRECKRNVWLREDGSCQFGHAASQVSNTYEVSTQKLAGYCSICKQNVWLREDGNGSCGHPANLITGIYDTDAEQKKAGKQNGIYDTGTKLIEKVEEQRTPAWIVGLLIVIALCFLASFMMSISSDKKEESKEEPTKKTTTKTTKEVEEPKEEEPIKTTPSYLNIGETGHGTNWDYTVNSFAVKDVLGDEWSEAKAGEGQKFLIVNVTFKNITKETCNISIWGSFDFKAHAAGDLSFDACDDFDVMVALENDYTDIGDVAPGGTATADIPFKISADATELTFEIGYDDLIWELK